MGEVGYSRGERTLLKGNQMSYNPLARTAGVAPPAASQSATRGPGAAQIPSQNPASAVTLKPPFRTKSVGTKVSEAEFAMLEERARAKGLTLSEWVREALLAGPVELEAGEVVLAEVLALRSLFLNLSFRQTAGKAGR